MELIVGQYGFLRWWAVTVSTQIMSWGGRVVAMFGDVFAIKLMLRHLNEPIFQDRTRQGRYIGILIRLARIIIGLFIEMLVSIAMGAILVLWYLFPLIALWGILR